jgi:hypothetical protein
VAYEQFAGQFIWADYAAPWCQPCEPQTQDVKAVDDSIGPEVVFFTVMTSDMEGYGDPATVETAARWASRFGLDPGRVLAADLTAMTIPKNLLFSPRLAELGGEGPGGGLDDLWGGLTPLTTRPARRPAASSCYPQYPSCTILLSGSECSR